MVCVTLNWLTDGVLSVVPISVMLCWCWLKAECGDTDGSSLAILAGDTVSSKTGSLTT